MSSCCRFSSSPESLADENGGNRAAGTSGYDASQAYVSETLEAAGYADKSEDDDNLPELR